MRERDQRCIRVDATLTLGEVHAKIKEEEKDEDWVDYFCNAASLIFSCVALVNDVPTVNVPLDTRVQHVKSLYFVG